MPITKEIAVYYNGEYYRNMRDFALSLLPENYDKDVDDWYFPIKTILIKYYPKTNDIIRIVDNNKLDNFLKGVNNTKKNFIDFNLDKEAIALACPFDFTKKKEITKEIKEKQKEERQIIREKIRQEKKIKIKKQKCDISMCPSSVNILEEKKVKTVKSPKYNEIYNQLYTLSVSKMIKLSSLTGISIAILNSLKYKVYPPSEILVKLIENGLTKLFYKRG